MEETSTRSTPELVMDVADDVRLLVRKEIELARIEFLEGLRAQLVGAALIGLALVASLPALLFGLFALAFWLPYSHEVSFSIVGAVLLALVALFILTGLGIMRRRRLRLKRSIESIKEDVRWARDQIRP
jgi:hypothetical protein